MSLVECLTNLKIKFATLALGTCHVILLIATKKVFLRLELLRPHVYTFFKFIKTVNSICRLISKLLSIIYTSLKHTSYRSGYS